MPENNYFVIPMQDVNNIESLGFVKQPENRPYYPATKSGFVKAIEEAVTNHTPIHNELKEGALRVEVEKLIATIRSKHSPANSTTPEHYKLKGLGIQWLEVRNSILNSITTQVSYVAVTAWSESITYLARMWRKNGIEDAYKARFYLDALIAELEGKDTVPRTTVEHDLRTELALTQQQLSKVNAENEKLATPPVPRMAISAEQQRVLNLLVLAHLEYTSSECIYRDGRPYILLAELESLYTNLLYRDTIRSIREFLNH